MSYSIEDFNFELPEELIASTALAERSASRMLTVERISGTFDDNSFAELPDHSQTGSVLIRRLR